MSIINKGIERHIIVDDKLIIGKLLIIQASIIDRDFEYAWKKIYEIIKIMSDMKYTFQENTQLLFQVYFYGCYTSFCLNKLTLSEYLGYQWVFLLNVSYKFHSV